MRNYCSTSATAWIPPETRAVYRKGRKIGELVGSYWSTQWVEFWFRGSAQDRAEFDRQLVIANL